MSLPKPQPSLAEQKMRVMDHCNSAIRLATERKINRLKICYDQLWAGDKTSIMAGAEAVNLLAASYSVSAVDIFTQHETQSLQCAAAMPELAGQLQPAPIDMTTVFNASGMIDLTAFETALDAWLSV